jgi:hypothetical protein
MRLYDHPVWLGLGHYEPAGRDGFASMARGDKFFVSEAGPTSPRDELHATLAAFFDPTLAVREGEHPQCTFRARYAWLVRELSIDPTRLPPASCEGYDTWRKGLAARGLSLIFPEAYMNNPASMFGHTLLRVDSGEPGGDEDLLAYAINFAAESGGDGGMAFAFKGIFGGYAGYFSVLPYYDKLKQYGDWENRDIWEYPLDLTAAEVDLLAHVWECVEYRSSTSSSTTIARTSSWPCSTSRGPSSGYAVSFRCGRFRSTRCGSPRARPI